MIRHLVRKMPCATFGCSRPATSTLVLQTPCMRGPGFYHYCDECAVSVESDRHGRYDVWAWRAV